MTTEQTRPAAAPSAPAVPSDLEFPQAFLWGAGTSSYQIEGAVAEDGRGVSIWDTFSHTPGRTLGGDTGDVAIDHYHQLDADLDLLAELGLGAYRFSVAWPRVQPSGSGPANPRGLAFYQRLVDGLLDRGIQPWVTLYHWDLPQPLEDAGGWPERDTAERFADYAMLVHDALGDRVRHWTTLNEPFRSAFDGYASGRHAPGRQEPAAALRAVHHLLLGHGLAVRALRDQGRDLTLGITLDLYAVTAADGGDAAADAARRVDGLHNRLFLDPLLRGSYPADVVADVATAGEVGPVHDGDLAVIASPLDMLGVNYYTRYVVAADGTAESGTPSPYVGSPQVRLTGRGLPRTGIGWEIDPDGLREVLLRLREEYPRVPLYVTENGAAFPDQLTDRGQVEDRDRIDFLTAHLRALREAMAAGVDLRGYFAWSLFDNFEWARGYSQRFGLIYVDYPTQRRIPKSSAHWYTRLIARDRD